MFGPKRKIDSRIRFQNSLFKNKLGLARGYKRPLGRIPGSAGDVFLLKIGLRTKKTKIAALAALVILVYVIFVPNIFFVKNITINGVKTEDQGRILTSIHNYLERRQWPWPQKNLLLLSKKGLESFLLQTDQKIFKIDSLNEKFPNSLTLNLQPRFGKFLLSLPSGTFLVSNDGVILNQLFPDTQGSSSQLSNLINLSLSSNDFPAPGQKYLNSDLSDFLLQTDQQLSAQTKNKVTGFEMSSVNDLDLKIQTTAGYGLIFDIKSDLKQTLDNLALLLSNLSDPVIKKLAYIDLRFKKRAYICQKDSACAKPATTQLATTTANTILLK